MPKGIRMAAKSPGRRHTSSVIANVQRHHGPGDPRLPELRRDLAVESLAEHIREVVDTAPPPTDAQWTRLAALLPAPPSSPGDTA
jgi:hypothetical protein